MAWLVFAATLIVCYLVGSINGAVLISKIIGKGDVRKQGSGNAGMTNMMRVNGLIPGLITFFIDTFKGTIACAIARYAILPYVFTELDLNILRPEYAVYFCGFACLAGHIWPVFFDFKGGKGVATTLGIGFICCWKTAIVAFLIFIIVVLITKIVSLGSLAAAFSLPLLNIVFAYRIEGDNNAVLIQCLLISVMAINMIFSHRANIVRLIHGEEKKLVIKKNKESK